MEKLRGLIPEKVGGGDLEPIAPEKLGLDCKLRITYLIGMNLPIDEGDLVLDEVSGNSVGTRTFRGTDSYGTIFDMIYEEDIMKGRVGLIRFDGIITPKESAK